MPIGSYCLYIERIIVSSNCHTTIQIFGVYLPWITCGEKANALIYIPLAYQSRIQ